MAYKSATGRISDAHVHVEDKKKKRASSRAMQRIVRQCKINDEREREKREG